MNDATATPPAEDDLPEQMLVRRNKRQQLLEAGEDPYPVVVDRTHTLKQIVTAYDAEALGADVQTGDIASITGRVIFLRNTGKLCFVRLREGDGTELQAMLSLDLVGEERLAAFKSLVDIGDHLAVTGEIITSRRGELSVQATSWQIAAKTVRPLPNEHNPLSDEARSRMRYVDLIVRPEARENVRVKAKVLQSLRATLDEREYVEVDTPRSSTPTAAPQLARSRRTPTRSTRTCCCASRSSCTSSAPWSAASTGSTRSARRSATRASTTPTTSSS